MKIGIIGYGSMGKMLLWKFSSNSKIAREDLYIANRTREKVLEAEEIAVVCDNRTLASECDIVFICVRPVFRRRDGDVRRRIRLRGGSCACVPRAGVRVFFRGVRAILAGAGRS